MRMYTQCSVMKEMSHAYVAKSGGIHRVQARAPCLLGVNAWRAWRFARVPVRRGATPRYASLHFQRKAAFGGAGGGGGGDGGRRRGVTITHTRRPATISGYRATGAGRPAGRLQQLCLLSRVARYARASRENSTTPMHRRPDATAAAMLRRSRKRVEAISGSDTTLMRANKDRPSLSLLLTLLPLSLSRSLPLSFLVTISICLTPSVLRARTMYIYNRTVSNAAQNIYVYIRAHAYIDT